MTTRYQRGARWEYVVAEVLSQEGYYVMRSAGSHKIDIIAMGQLCVRFIEAKVCRTKGLPSYKQVRKEMAALAQRFGFVEGEMLSVISFELWVNYRPPGAKTPQTLVLQYAGGDRWTLPYDDHERYIRSLPWGERWLERLRKEGNDAGVDNGQPCAFRGAAQDA